MMGVPIGGDDWFEVLPWGGTMTIGASWGLLVSPSAGAGVAMFRSSQVLSDGKVEKGDGLDSIHHILNGVEEKSG